MERECWRPIEGYEGANEISNIGRVRDSNGRVCKNWPDHYGYPYTKLIKNGVVKRAKVHRLVGAAFIPNPENKHDINHKNGVKADNRVENLEWATRQENIQHAYDTGLREPKGAREGENANTILTREQVWEIRAAPNNQSAWRQHPMVCYSLISKIRRRVAWKWLPEKATA